MPGGLLDMFGIDPVANRNRKMQLMLQELQNKGQMDVEKQRGSNDISTTRERGSQERLTQAQKGEVEKALETLRSHNVITEAEANQKLKFLSDIGVPHSEENLKTADKALTDTRIRKALQADAQTVEARQAPGYADSLAAGMQAANLTPAFANQKTGTITAQPGELVAQPPSGISLPPTNLNQYNQMQGSTENQTVEEIPNPAFPMMPPQVKVLKQQTPGRIKLPPNILQQAQGLTPQAPTMPQPQKQQWTVDDILRGAGIIPTANAY